MFTNQDHTSPLFAIICTVILGAVVVVFARMIWNIMKENNTFMKEDINHYGESEEKKEKEAGRVRYYYGLGISVNIVGFICFVVNSGSVKNTTVAVFDYVDDRSANYLLYSFFATLALFVYAWLNEPAFSFIRNFRYSLKVWFTTLGLATLLVLIAERHFVPSGAAFILLSYFIAAFINGLGCITYCSLIYTTKYFSANNWKPAKRRRYILGVTQVILFINVIIVSAITRGNINLTFVWISFAIVMGCSIMFYPMDKTVYSDDTATTTSTIEEK